MILPLHYISQGDYEIMEKKEKQKEKDISLYHIPEYL